MFIIGLEKHFPIRQKFLHDYQVSDFIRNHCDFFSDLYEEIVKPFYAKMN